MDHRSTEQTVLWFRDRYREGRLDLKKPYQRKPVWMARQKCSLIETILMDLPIPEVFLEMNVVTMDNDAHEHWGVIDGQQRIRAILQFIGSETDDEEAGYNGFPLDKLDTGSQWRNLTFDELSDEERQRIWQTKIAIRELKPQGDREVRDMFMRLNKFLTPLNEQELRKATYIGPFIRLADTLADDEYWTEQGLVRPADIRRMKDVELVSELVIGVLHGPQGGSARIIDDYYAQYEDYDEEFPTQRGATRLFRGTMALVKDLFPSIREHRWGNRTDFYSLFVALAALQRTGKPVRSRLAQLRRELVDLEEQVDSRLADEEMQVAEHVVDYVRAVEKGANDKARRGARHVVLTTLMQPFFQIQAKKR